MKRDEEWLLKEKYDGKKTEGFFADLKRLDSGEPLAYVIGWMPFLGTNIYLDSRPLIPRPETEFWTEKAITEIRNIMAARILDLCAGSGCIGVAVLKEIPYAYVDFAEMVERHHATIRKNVLENGIDMSRARIFGGDLFENIHDTYDVILANPPYIPIDSDRVQKSVIEFEPHSALFAGTEGIDVLVRILTDVPRFLKTGGCLYLEHEPEQVPFIETEARTYGFEMTSYNDQHGVQRYTKLVRKS